LKNHFRSKFRGKFRGNSVFGGKNVWKIGPRLGEFSPIGQ
jgi:hypothetical protein